MKIKAPMMFFSCGDCSGSAPAGALICNPDYNGLDSITRVRLIGVPLGASCQQFLKRAGLDNQGGIGFVFMGADGQAYVEQAPQLTLPYINPAVSGVFPPDGSFLSLIVGTGSDPLAWRMLHAPSSGEKVLTAKDGVFLLKDPSSATGQTAVCYQDGSVAMGNIVVCVKTGVDGDGFPTYQLSKLTVVHKRLVEGYVDPDTGAVGYRSVPADKEVEHPFAKFGLIREASFIQYDLGTGADEAGGMAPQPQTGGGAITDAQVVVYSPTTHKFYRLPARTKESLTVNTDVVVADNGSFVSMGGHCLWNNLQFNFPDFLFTCSVRMRSDGTDYNNIHFGLFVDGVLVNDWDLKNDASVALSYIHKGLTIGQHTVDLRYKQTAGADVMTIKFSTATINSLI